MPPDHLARDGQEQEHLEAAVVEQQQQQHQQKQQQQQRQQQQQQERAPARALATTTASMMAAAVQETHFGQQQQQQQQQQDGIVAVPVEEEQEQQQQALEWLSSTISASINVTSTTTSTPLDGGASPAFSTTASVQQEPHLVVVLEEEEAENNNNHLQGPASHSSASTPSTAVAQVVDFPPSAAAAAMTEEAYPPSGGTNTHFDVATTSSSSVPPTLEEIRQACFPEHSSSLPHNNINNNSSSSPPSSNQTVSYQQENCYHYYQSQQQQGRIGDTTAVYAEAVAVEEPPQPHQQQQHQPQQHSPSTTTPTADQVLREAILFEAEASLMDSSRQQQQGTTDANASLYPTLAEIQQETLSEEDYHGDCCGGDGETKQEIASMLFYHEPSTTDYPFACVDATYTNHPTASTSPADASTPVFAPVHQYPMAPASASGEEATQEATVLVDPILDQPYFPLATTTPVARMPSSTRAQDDDENEDEDDDGNLVAMKRAAYAGLDTVHSSAAQGQLPKYHSHHYHHHHDSNSILTTTGTASATATWQQAVATTATLTELAADQKGTVISVSNVEEIHPSDLTAPRAAQAQLIGEDYSSPAASRRHHAATMENHHHSPPEATLAGTTTATAFPATAVDDAALTATVCCDTATEATVIDSAPLVFNQDGDEVSQWKFPAEEAQVLQEEDPPSLPHSELDRKPPASDPPTPSTSRHIADGGTQATVAMLNDLMMVEGGGEATARATTTMDSDEFAVIADEEAQVVAIQESIHPSEFTHEDEMGARAELVATDYNLLSDPNNYHLDMYNGAVSATVLSTTATATTEHTPTSSTTMEVVVTASSTPPAQATWVETTTTTTGQQPSSYHHHSSSSSTTTTHAEGAATPAIAIPTAATLPMQVGGDATPIATAATLAESTSATTTFATATTLPVECTETTTNRASRFSSPSCSTLRAESFVFVEDQRTSSETENRPSSVATATAGNASSNVEEADDIDRPGWLREEGMPPQRHPLDGSDRVNSAESTASSSQRSGIEALSNNIARSTSNVMEALFGQSTPPFGTHRRRVTADSAAHAVCARRLLPWSVIYSPPTNMWVATLQTNQRALEKNNVKEASKSLRAFSLPTEKQAVCLARAWTPPRMIPFSEQSSCFICSSKFAIFRRAHHCRNCGVCVCKDCTTLWPARMIPETYNRRKENFVNICRSCDWLCNEFRLALLAGNQDRAVALHEMGNVNLHAPFANVKGELFYPVHCAVLGGNHDLLKWLVDTHCCPIKSVRVSVSSKDSKYTPIVTSKGRSLLGIAMEKGNVQIIRYLVVDKGIALSGEKDITSDMLMSNLETVLRLLPADHVPENTIRDSGRNTPPAPSLPAQESFHEVAVGGRTLSQEARDFGAVRYRASDDGEADSAAERREECIICFDGEIDCVATPCGHQVCCLECSTHITRCPVCSCDCTFMRVFKP